MNEDWKRTGATWPVGVGITPALAVLVESMLDELDYKIE